MVKVLLGFMGVGKLIIVRGLDLVYFDMDVLIEKCLGMFIVEFFLEKGEEFFCQVELEILVELL